MKKKLLKIIRIILAILIIPAVWFAWIVYDEALCESARLSKEFNVKMSSLEKSKVKSFRLSDLTNFEWDVVCIYGENESINLKDLNLTKQIGYKPKFFIRSTYYVPYDFAGFLYSNSSTKEIKVLHRAWNWYHFELNSQKINYIVGCYKKNQELLIVK